MRTSRTLRRHPWAALLQPALFTLALAALAFSTACRKGGGPSTAGKPTPTPPSAAMKTMLAEMPREVADLVVNETRATLSASKDARALWREPEDAGLSYYHAVKLLADVARADGLSSNPVVTENVRNQLLQKYADKLFERTKGEIPVSDEEIAQYYDEHRSEYHSRGRFAFRQIFLNTVDNPGKEKEKEALATKALKEANAGTSFVKVAEKYSDNKDKGELIGPEPFGSINPDFEQLFLTMKAGEVSKVVRGKYGLFLFRLEAVEPPTTKTLEQVRDSIVQILRDEQLPKFYERFAAMMEQRYPVKRNYDALRDPKTTSDTLIVDSTFLQITAGEFRALVDKMAPAGRTRLDVAENRAEFLDSWIETKRIEKAAKDDGLADAPEFKAVERYLTDSELASLYLRVATTRMPPPNDNDAVKHYKDYYGSYTREPAKYRLRELVLSYKQPPGTSPREIHLARQKTLERAQEIVAQLKGGAKFEDLARQYSQSASAPNGGELGFIDPDRRWRFLRENLAKLKPGQYTEPLDEGEQLSLFLYEELKPEVVAPLDDTLKTQIKEVLSAELRKKRELYVRVKLAKTYRKGMTVDETRKLVEDLVSKTEDELPKL